MESGIVRVPFRFHLKECERLSTLVWGLPSSLDSDEEGRRLSDGQYSVTYSLTATALSSRECVASVTEKISVLSVTQEPSICSADCPGEYFWAKTIPQHLMSLHKRPSAPRIEAAGQEPQAVVLDAHDTASGGSVEVPFVLKLSPKTADGSNLSTMQAQCRVKARLVTETRITPDGLEQLASSVQRGLDKVPSSRSEDVQIQTSHDQEELVDIPGWCHANPSKSSITDERHCFTDRIVGFVEPFSVSRLSFLFSISAGKPLIPTFTTPLLSRSYAIDATLSFPGSPLPSMKMSIPLEIVYEASDTDYHADSEKRRTSVTEVRLQG